MDKPIVATIAFMCFVFGFVFCFIAACHIGYLRRKSFESEAVMHGAAEYVIANPENGTVVFKWKDELDE